LISLKKVKYSTKRSFLTALTFLLLFSNSIVSFSQEPTTQPPPSSTEQIPTLAQPTLPTLATETPTATPTLIPTFTETTTNTPIVPETNEATSEVTVEQTLTPSETLPPTLIQTFTSVPPIISPSVTITPTEAQNLIGAEPFMQLIFADNFDAGEMLLWTLGQGWSFVPYKGGQALQASLSDELLTFANNNIYNAAFEVHLQIRDSIAQISTRVSQAGSYTVIVNNDGTAELYRGSSLLQASNLVLPIPEDGYKLRLSVVDDVVRVSMNGIEIIAVRDAEPLPAGAITLTGSNLESGSLLIDDFSLFIPSDQNLVQPTATEIATAEPQLNAINSQSFDNGSDLSMWMADLKPFIVSGENGQVLHIIDGVRQLPL
jgi:hypothetical protein